MVGIRSANTGEVELMPADKGADQQGPGFVKVLSTAGTGYCSIAGLPCDRVSSLAVQCYSCIRICRFPLPTLHWHPSSLLLPLPSISFSRHDFSSSSLSVVHLHCVVLDLLPKGPRMDRSRQVRPTGVPRTHQGRDLREPKSGQSTRHAPSSARLVQVMPMSPGPMTPTSPGSPFI